MTDSKPNILWYCTDQQRYDTIRALGNPHISTPHLDRLASKGVAFRRAYVQSQICTPSRASFLTGRYPSSTHVHRNGNEYFPDSETLVTRLLADAGYECGLVGKLHLASAERDVERRTDDGYSTFVWSHHPMPGPPDVRNDYGRWLIEEKGVDHRDLYSSIGGFCTQGVPAELHQSTWCTEMAIRFIEQAGQGPWLLSVNPFDPHPPFDPPKEFVNRYDPQDLPPPLFRETDLERQKQFIDISQQAVEAVNPEGRIAQAGVDEDQTTLAAQPPDQFDGRQVKAHYYAMIELLDEQFGRLVSYLEASGQIDNTLIVFHSDHGEQLGDHGLLYKGCRFFEGLVHVPLIFFWKGRILSDQVSEALVELVDIAPTLLEAAEVEIPYFIQGKSLLPLLRGEADLHRHKQSVVTEFNDALGSARRSLPTHATMTFDGRYKTIVYHGHGFGELFDLQEDPGEFDNLWNDSEHQELKLTLLHKHLDAVMATSSPGVRRVGKY